MASQSSAELLSLRAGSSVPCGSLGLAVPECWRSLVPALTVKRSWSGRLWEGSILRFFLIFPGEHVSELGMERGGECATRERAGMMGQI